MVRIYLNAVYNITNNLSAVQNAATNATTATTKASEAATSATNAASSATSAASSASTATTKASEASTSATNSASSASTASGHKDTATTKASEAASSATAAAASASTASTQASNAATSASTSSTQATNSASSATASANSATAAASSATAAASSATAAAASQTAAAASASSAASSFDSFDDRYLGPKSSDPSQDNDGNSLVSGALYFNSTANEMRVYDGANWIAATSAGNVSLTLYEYTATAGQTTFSGSDDNSATLSYTVDNLQVVMNGVILDPSDFTATNGTSVVLASGAALNDLVNIYAFKSFTTADMVSKTNGGTFAGAVTFDAGANFGDNVRARFGAGNDLQIYHDGSDSYINDTGTGNLRLAGAAGVDIIADSGETMAKFISNGASELYHNNGKSLETTSVGVTVNGNLGVGTASPSGLLNVHNASGDANMFITTGTTTSSTTILFGDSGSTDRGRVQYDHNGDSMRFHTAGSERGRFTSDGKFRLNATSNQVTGYELFTCNGAAGFRNGDASVVGVWQTQTSAFAMQFFSGSAGNNVGSISVTANSTAYNTSSDYRLKEAVTPLTNATDRLKQLNPVRFNFISDADTTVDGFLAHEVSDIVPEAISGEKDAMKDEEYEVTPAVLDDDGNEVTPAEMGTRTVPDYQGIDQSKLVPLLVATIQELEARIAALETA